jgi:8-oxo-dGTP diphosphatase
MKKCVFIFCKSGGAMNSKPVFGKIEENIKYKLRKAVYAIILNNEMDEVFSVKTKNNHYFLPGGGIEKDESPEDALFRELIEETGYAIKVQSKIGEAVRFFHSLNNAPIQNDAAFYFAQLEEKIKVPIAHDHSTEWVRIEEIDRYFVHEHHIWAVFELIMQSKK